MFICSHCGTTSPKWTGKCPNCHEWNTFYEQEKDAIKWKIKWWKSQLTTPLHTKNTHESIDKYISASQELDGVLGWWMVSGSLILLSGEPWIGKSTLALQMSEWYSQQKSKTNISWVLYISGEENLMQVTWRAKRLSIHWEHIEFLSESNFDNILLTIEESSANIIIIDSLSVLFSNSIDGTPGSISQIRVMTEMCMQTAKKLWKSIILIWHVTKDGSIGWPKSLEHLVDVVLFLEWVRTENYRILRALKNRFWSTDTVGLFRMQEDGLHDLSNPWLEFIDKNASELSWSALTFTIEGNRPILIEIEALTSYTKFGYPKRSSRWVAQWKLELLIAVMAKYTDIKLDSSDVYLNIARGLSVSDPGIDLACIAAILSSKKSAPLGKTIYLWEVWLTGVIKNIQFLEKRIFEAAKLGFTDIVIPHSYTWKIPKNITPKSVQHVRDIF